MLERTIKWILNNFDLFMFILAAIFMLAHILIDRKVSPFEILYRWFSLLPLGVTLIYVSTIRAVAPEFTQAILGWSNSPLHYEAALACFSFGAIAILSFKASYGFRLATVIGSTIWLWGNAIGRIYQVSLDPALTFGTGSWLLLDIILPLFLAVAMVKLRPLHQQRLKKRVK